MMLAGMGLLNTMPMLATLTVEKGLLAALGEVLQVFLSGGPMYFMFHIQTRAHYFYQTLLAGGAQYRATGRGFVTHHSCFDDLYRFFANSHFYLGFEVGVFFFCVCGGVGVHVCVCARAFALPPLEPKCLFCVCGCVFPLSPFFYLVCCY